MTNESFNTLSGSVAKVLKEAVSHPGLFYKKGVLKNFAKLAGVFFEFCQVFKNIYFEEHLWAAGSVFANS